MLQEISMTRSQIHFSQGRHEFHGPYLILTLMILENKQSKQKRIVSVNHWNRNCQHEDA